MQKISTDLWYSSNSIVLRTWENNVTEVQVIGHNIGTAMTKKSGRPYWFWASHTASMGRWRDRRHSLRKRVLPCVGGKLSYSESNASDTDANLLSARENLHSQMKMCQMLMHQNLRPRISLNRISLHQPLIHHIQGCEILPLNQALIQLNPRAQVFPNKMKICISSWCKLNPRLQVFLALPTNLASAFDSLTSKTASPFLRGHQQPQVVLRPLIY